MSEPKQPGPSFEIPDLELAAPVSKRAAQPSPQRPAPLQLTPETAAFGLEISLPDLDDEDEQLLQKGSNLDLSIGTSPQATKRHQEDWPQGRTRPADQLPIDPAEVSLLAGYGPAPSNALLAPLYAYRVLSRRSPLKRALAAQNAELVQAELARDTRLMQLATELRPALEANEAFRRMLEPIRHVEQVAGERSAALSQADAGYREQMARFDAELLQLREAEAQAQALLAQKSQAADTSQNELRRAEAKHQRVQIEIRGVLDVARQALGPAGGDLSPVHTAKLSELQDRLKAIEPELTQAKSGHAAAQAAEEQAQAELRRQQSQIQKLERQKASASSSLEKQLSVRAASVSEAEQQRRNAWADVARAVLAARGAVQVPQPLLQALREHDQSVEMLAVRLETHVRALDAYDGERVKQGVILVLSALGVVLVSILLKAML
jgi:hypothetical protein